MKMRIFMHIVHNYFINYNNGLYKKEYIIDKKLINITAVVIIGSAPLPIAYGAYQGLKDEVTTGYIDKYGREVWTHSIASHPESQEIQDDIKNHFKIIHRLLYGEYKE